MTNRIPRFQIMARDDFRCVYCGATPCTTELHIDHVVPRSRGGSDETWNLATACAACNISKTNTMPPDEVIREVYERDCYWPYLGNREPHLPCFHCGRPVPQDPDDAVLPAELVRCEPCDGTVCDTWWEGYRAGYKKCDEEYGAALRVEVERRGR